MNLYHAHLMSAPSIEPRGNGLCPLCGRARWQEHHHIVPRSQGGTNGPTVAVCGHGNTDGCHGALHDHKLHLWFEDGWRYLRTSEPMKLEKALMEDGWLPLVSCPELDDIGADFCECFGRGR